MWFEDLTGFREENPDQVRANLIVDGSTITSKVSGRRMEAGRLQTPSLRRLRNAVIEEGSGLGAISVEEVVADAQALHVRAEAAGSLFQVASQFNLLEMVGPHVPPEAGVGIYENDLTQGPACAIAAGAGTIYRNYFAEVNGMPGQSAHNQIDCLKDVGNALGNEANRLWSVQNGYALPSLEGLREIDGTLARMDEAELDNLRAALRIGLQWDTEVTFADCGHLITQAFCSALPVAYTSLPRDLWERFARLVLEATYEATLTAAAINSTRTGNNRVYLTLVGGGAFGNDTDWIVSALNRALRQFERYPLDVKIVSYGNRNPHLRELLSNMK